MERDTKGREGMGEAGEAYVLGVGASSLASLPTVLLILGTRPPIKMGRVDAGRVGARERMAGFEAVPIIKGDAIHKGQAETVGVHNARVGQGEHGASATSSPSFELFRGVMRGTIERA